MRLILFGSVPPSPRGNGQVLSTLRAHAPQLSLLVNPFFVSHCSHALARATIVSRVANIEGLFGRTPTSCVALILYRPISRPAGPIAN